jgi:hypothetical protein
MSRSPFLPALPALALLAGCVSSWERSYDRWYDYRRGESPYANWANCIEAQSSHYLDPDRSTDETDVQLFTDVLRDCRPHMSESHWRSITSARMKQLIGDAWQAFNNVSAEVMARRDAETI